MNRDNHVFISWEERFVCKEKGRRVVHYYLKDSLGELLAVVGTEKSARHMVYVVSEDYLDAFGRTSTINSETKWRAKRDVVGWLTSLMPKHHRSSPISMVFGPAFAYFDQIHGIPATSYQQQILGNSVHQSQDR